MSESQPEKPSPDPPPALGTDQVADLLKAALEAGDGKTARRQAPGTMADPERTTPPGPTEGDHREASPWPCVPGYEILGELGRGGMGVVYRARQCDLKRLVALKMIRQGTRDDQEFLKRFKTEAEAVARLQHANIVQIFEVGEHGGQPFFSLELVDGGSLARKIARTSQPPGDAAMMVEKLARAMAHAHARGIVHRDLKPGNVLLTADGTPKVADFGLAKLLEEDAGQTVAGRVFGTPSYMAPEQAAGRNSEVGPACDVYALGAILYEMLTGRAPFLGKTKEEILKQVCEREPAPPSRLRPAVPRDLELICLMCLHKEPHRRYANAGQLADELCRYWRGEPLALTRRVRTVERLWYACYRQPTRAAACVLLVAFAALAATFVGYRIRVDADAAM